MNPFLISKREEFKTLISLLQNHICSELENLDGTSVFSMENWERDGFGSGSTRIISNGSVFEKGGVNTSVVQGCLPTDMQERFGVKESDFFAAGISLVLHPQNPFVPTVHANYRYFELYDKYSGVLKDQWFGGGADLTPSYLFKEDARHFHNTHKKVCDRFDPSFYINFKNECDIYFYNHHREESRGIGGLFFDFMRPDSLHPAGHWFAFCEAAGNAFLDAYMPIVKLRKEMPYTEKNRYWQEIRRGRYVEFNLIHDRGTLFGLKTKGRIESILMSLPPCVRWDYNYQPEPNSKEAELIDHLKPINWVNY